MQIFKFLALINYCQKFKNSLQIACSQKQKSAPILEVYLKTGGIFPIHHKEPETAILEASKSGAEPGIGAGFNIMALLTGTRLRGSNRRVNARMARKERCHEMVLYGFRGQLPDGGPSRICLFVSSMNRKNFVFIMQHRTLDPGVAIPNTEQALTIVSDIQISFCPWCGTDLHKFYQKRYQELDRNELEVSSQ